jgi:hypothetical protein
VKKSRTVPEALSMTPSAKEGSYESQSLSGRNPKSATVQAIALGSPQGQRMKDLDLFVGPEGQFVYY